MAWDAVHNSLYAVTECRYMDHLGRNFDYRGAKISQDQDPEDDELEDDDKGYEGRCWSKRAHHGEDYFGYLFDAEIIVHLCECLRHCQLGSDSWAT